MAAKTYINAHKLKEELKIQKKGNESKNLNKLIKAQKEIKKSKEESNPKGVDDYD